VKSTRLIRIITSLSLGVVFLSAATWVGLGQISGQISRVNVFSGLGDRPEKVNSALNYLVVGSDNREGLSKEQLKKLRVGGIKVAAGGRSDTMLLVHISKDRDAAYIVSLPRDTLVTIPAHISQDGKSQIPARPGKLNAAFAFGGAPLLIQTIEGMTQLKIDHYVEVSFAGFVGVVDALGGIQVCSKVAINDPKSHLVMSAGSHLLDGLEALKYVRTRDFDGLGDIGRMQRQQQFMASVLRKATSAGVLLNPVKLLNFFKAAISTVKTDSGLSQNDLLTLGQQMGKLSANKVRTLTVPLSTANGSYPGLGSVVIWDAVKAPELFNRLINDIPIYDVATPSPSAKATNKANKSGAKATPKPTIIEQFKVRTAAENPCGQINY
jgi:LCP family protein required for cell wall assembly